ncbi:MAG: hypothetical protein MI919_00705, partial [Holophagales bacterium]|nr:hypothetical protein [Holophagales bacterium]
ASRDGVRSPFRDSTPPLSDDRRETVDLEVLPARPARSREGGGQDVSARVPRAADTSRFDA